MMSGTTTLVLRSAGKPAAPSNFTAGEKKSRDPKKSSKGRARVPGRLGAPVTPVLPTADDLNENREDELPSVGHVNELFPGLSFDEPAASNDGEGEVLLPDVSQWTLEHLNDERYRMQAVELVGAELSAESLMQWKAAMMKFIGIMRPALQATRNTFQLLAINADVNFDAVDCAANGGLETR
jgi:hypothetical protein